MSEFPATPRKPRAKPVADSYSYSYNGCGQRNWTPDEDSQLLDHYEQRGQQWRRIAAKFTDRSPDDVMGRYMHLISCAAEGLVDDALDDAHAHPQLSDTDEWSSADPINNLADCDLYADYRPPSPLRPPLPGENDTDRWDLSFDEFAHLESLT